MVNGKKKQIEGFGISSLLKEMYMTISIIVILLLAQIVSYNYNKGINVLHIILAFLFSPFYLFWIIAIKQMKIKISIN